jgi:hypothetical protein
VATFTNEVPEEIRVVSRWDEDYACYVTPDGRSWRYTDDPRGEGVSWRDSQGDPVSVAVWTDDDPA